MPAFRIPDPSRQLASTRISLVDVDHCRCGSRRVGLEFPPTMTARNKLAPGETKRIRGKVYVVPADVAALVARFERDFPEQAAKKP